MAKGVVIREHKAVTVQPKDVLAVTAEEKVDGKTPTFHCAFCHKILPLIKGMGRVFQLTRCDGEISLACRSCVTHYSRTLKIGGVSTKEL